MLESFLPIVQVLLLLICSAGVGWIPGLQGSRRVPLRRLTFGGLSPSVVVVQLSDMHLSVQNHKQYEALQNLIAGPLASIEPDAVVISGDMVDAKRSMFTWETKGQLAQEWDTYLQAVQLLHEQLPSCTIIDLPGNHCRFNEALLGQSRYFLKRLGSQMIGPRATFVQPDAVTSRPASDAGLVRRHRAVDIFPRRATQEGRQDLALADSSLRVVLVDATVNPAPNRHFFGRLAGPDLDRVESLLRAGSDGGCDHSIQKVNSTAEGLCTADQGTSCAVGMPASIAPLSASIVVSHFPANSIVIDGGIPALARVYDNGNVAMAISGHLHQLPQGDAPGMKGTGRRLHGVLGRGTLELEQPDFKSHGRYRIIVAKGPLVRFSEPRLRSSSSPHRSQSAQVDSTDAWDPVVVVTSPAIAEYVRPADVEAGDACLSDVRPHLLDNLDPVAASATSGDEQAASPPIEMSTRDGCVGCLEAVAWGRGSVRQMKAQSVRSVASKKVFQPLDIVGSKYSPAFRWTRTVFRASRLLMSQECGQSSKGNTGAYMTVQISAQDERGDWSEEVPVRLMCGPLDGLEGQVEGEGPAGVDTHAQVPGLPASWFATHSLRDALGIAAALQSAVVIFMVLWPGKRALCSVSSTDRTSNSVISRSPWRVAVLVWVAWLWVGPWFFGFSLFMDSPGVMFYHSHMGAFSQQLRDRAVAAQQAWDSSLLGIRATTGVDSAALTADSDGLIAGVPTALGGLLYAVPHLDGPIYVCMCLVLCVTPFAQLFLLREWHDARVSQQARGQGGSDAAIDAGVVALTQASSVTNGFASTVTSWLWGRPASLFGAGLLLGPLLGIVVICLPLALFQGVDCALLCPVFTWASVGALGWGAHEVGRDVWARLYWHGRVSIGKECPVAAAISFGDHGGTETKNDQRTRSFNDLIQAQARRQKQGPGQKSVDSESRSRSGCAPMAAESLVHTSNDMALEVVHFDVNKTIITTDKASGQSTETLIDGLIARNVYGMVSIADGPMEDENSTYGVPKPGHTLHIPPRTQWRFQPIAPDDPRVGGRPMPPARVLEAGSKRIGEESPAWDRAVTVKQTKLQLRALRASTVGAVSPSERGKGLLTRVQRMTEEGRVTSLENFLQEYAYPKIPLDGCEKFGYDMKAARAYNKDVAKHFRRRVTAALIRGLTQFEISEDSSTSGSTSPHEVKEQAAPKSHAEANARIIEATAALPDPPALELGVARLAAESKSNGGAGGRTTATDIELSASHLMEIFRFGMAGDAGGTADAAAASGGGGASDGGSSGPLPGLKAYRRLLYAQWRELMRLAGLSKEELMAVEHLRSTPADRRHPTAVRLPEPMEELCRGIVPAFFRFVERQLLDPDRRERFAIVFRTFGTDLPDIGAEWNMYCAGAHPYERPPPEVGLLDGSGPLGVDMRLSMPASTAMIQRSGFAGEHLAVATVREAEVGGGRGACTQLVGYRALDGWIRSRIAAGHRCLAVRDCYRFWNDKGEKAGAGKVVLVDAGAWAMGGDAAGSAASGGGGDEMAEGPVEVHPVFFDDNVLRRRAKIVDVRVIPPSGHRFPAGAGEDADTDDEGGPEGEAAGVAEARVPFALTRGVVAVRAEIGDALRDTEYFCKEMEAARKMWPSFKAALASKLASGAE